MAVDVPDGHTDHERRHPGAVEVDAAGVGLPGHRVKLQGHADLRRHVDDEIAQTLVRDMLAS